MEGVSSPPFCGKYIHTGRLNTRLKTSLFKKFNVMSFNEENRKSWKYKKINISTKVQINKHSKLLRGVLKKQLFWKLIKMIKKSLWRSSFFSKLAGGETSEVFFWRISTTLSIDRVRVQLFLKIPFSQNSSLQLLLNTRFTFDRSIVNVYFECNWDCRWN